MPTRKYSSRSQQTTLSSGITSSDATATVVSGSNLLSSVTFSTAGTFTVVIDPDTALEEIVDVTARSGNTLTITRGVENSGTGVAHSAGAVVRHMVTGRDLQEANDHASGTLAQHGATTSAELNSIISDNTGSGSLVFGTSPTISSPTITGTGAIAGTFTGNLTGNVTGNVTGSSGSTTGSAATLTTGRDFQLVGDVEASAVSFNGSGNVSLTTVIGTGVIVNADVNAFAAIAKSKLNLGGTITSADLVDGTIVATDIADGTITAAKLVSDPYARANHTGTQLAATVSDFDTQVRTSRLDQMAAPTGSVSVNSQKITSLATPTVNTDAATKLYVDTKVADLVNSAPSTLDTLGEIATAIQAGGTVYDSFVLKSGSTMTGNLTLAGAPSSNLHAATKLYVDDVAGSATAAAASAAAAATTYDNFDDRYLGAKSTAPSVDNDGNALITGALYWNSTSATMFAWTGSAWGSISSTAAIFRFRFTAAGGETSESGLDDNGVTLSYIPGKEQVYLNGVLLVRTTDYTASNGTSITSLAALSAGDILEIITFTAFDLATAISNTLFDAKGDILVATAADTPGKLTVGSNGQVLKANSATATGLEWVADSAYSAPTLGSTSIASGATVTTIAGLTLTSPTISTITNTGTVTLPTATDTLVGRATTDTLTNKTLTTPVITNPKITLTYSAKTAAYTFVSGDEGNVFSMNNASTTQFNIPTDATFNFAIGTQFNVFWLTGAGQPTIGAVTPGTTTVISTGATSATPKLRVANSMATCLKIAANSWIVIGDIA
jgi:hypothetical protein